MHDQTLNKSNASFGEKTRGLVEPNNFDGNHKGGGHDHGINNGNSHKNS